MPTTCRQLAERTVNEKRKLNQHAFISRLHPEIFSTIFCIVRDNITNIPLYSPLWGLQHWIGLSRITHVCHTWRDIAINTPVLWAKISMTVKDQLNQYVQEMLRRSKRCPLSVVISNPVMLSLPASGLVGTLHHHMPQVRQLSLLDIQNVDPHNFFSNSHTHWDRLERLRIRVRSNNPEIFSDPPHTFVLNDDILRINTLQYLSIVHCGLDFHATFLRSLRHLELFDIDEGSRLSSSDFIAVLANIPALEVLNLGEFLKEDDVDNVGEYVTTQNKTHLRCMKYLDLECNSPKEMTRFLFPLILPSSCKLHLQIWDENIAIAPAFDVKLIPSWISRHFQPPPSPFHDVNTSFQNYIHDLHIDESTFTDMIVVSGFREQGSHMLTEKNDEAILLVSVYWPYEHGSPDDFWPLLLTPLPLSNIVSLKVTDDCVTLPDSVWTKVFGRIATLKTIIIESNDYGAFFDTLSPDSSNPVALPFPALSSVTVRAHRIRHYPSSALSLELRLEAGLAPFDLVFYTDYIEPQAISRLRKCTSDVQVHPFNS